MADSIDPAAKLKTGDARDNKLGTVIGQVPVLVSASCITSAMVDIDGTSLLYCSNGRSLVTVFGVHLPYTSNWIDKSCC